MKVNIMWIPAVAVLLLAGNPRPLSADEIEDQIKQGLDQYKGGSYSESVQSLQYAVGQIQKKQAENLKEIFPEPLDGWTASEAEGNFAPMAMMGGGVTASRKYKDKTGQQVEIEVITNAPMLQGVLMMMSNPMFMASEPDSKLIKVKGYKAILKYSSGNGKGEMSIPIQNQMLVQFNGRKLESQQPLLDYGDKMNYEGLEKFLAQ